MEDKSNIIQKVKDALGINCDTKEIDLLKSLKKKMCDSHPDKFPNEEAKKKAEERFKELREMYDELNRYIQNDIVASHLLVEFSETDRLELTYINKLDSKDKKIEQLNFDKEMLEQELKSGNAKIEKLEKKNDELLKSKVELKREDLASMYAPKTAYNVVGVTSLVTMMATFTKPFRDLLQNNGVPYDIISIISILILSVWGLKWLRKKMISVVIESIENSIQTSPDNIEDYMRVERFSYPDIMRLNNYDCVLDTYAFKESDISKYVRKSLTRGWRKMLFFSGLDKTVKNLTDRIILEFDRRKLIAGSEPDGFTRVFFIKKRRYFYQK